MDKYLINNVPKGIILSGGPSSVISNDNPELSEKIISCDSPILAICYGLQSLVKILGGQIINSDKSEFGRAKVRINQDSMLTKNLWTGFSTILSIL